MNITSQESHFLLCLGSKIRHFRKEKGLSQEALSFKSDLHRTYIGSVERGERNISVLNLMKIAEALEVSVSDFFKFDYITQ